MIKLFRNIRKKLLEQGKTVNYLKYAIGEIVLLVIGILIALQVNNWNVERLENKESSKIKFNINKEFEQNKILLQTIRHYNKNAFDANLALLNLMGENKEEIQKHNLDSLFYKALEAKFYLPTKNAIDGIFQTGKLNLIADNTKNAILNWNSNLEMFKSYKDVQTNWQNSQLIPYMILHVALVQSEKYGTKNWGRESKLKTDYYTMFQDIKFENIIDNNLFLLQLLIDQMDTLNEIQDKIIQQTN